MEVAGHALSTAERGDLSAGIPYIRNQAKRFGAEWIKTLTEGRGNPFAGLKRKLKTIGIPEAECQRGKECLALHEETISELRSLSKDTDSWTASNVQSKINELRTALANAESSANACAATLSLTTAAGSASRTQKRKEKRTTDKAVVTLLKEYQAARLPTAWRNLIRDLGLLPNDSGEFPEYTPSHGPKKAEDSVDWSLPASWNTEDGGSARMFLQLFFHGLRPFCIAAVFLQRKSK